MVLASLLVLMKPNHQKFSELIKSFLSTLPEQVGQTKAEVEAILQTFAQHCINQSELLSKEEFLVQTKVLQKTRSKLQELEQRLTQLEQESN